MELETFWFNYFFNFFSNIINFTHHISMVLDYFIFFKINLVLDSNLIIFILQISCNFMRRHFIFLPNILQYDNKSAELLFV